MMTTAITKQTTMTTAITKQTTMTTTITSKRQERKKERKNERKTERKKRIFGTKELFMLNEMQTHKRLKTMLHILPLIVSLCLVPF